MLNFSGYFSKKFDSRAFGVRAFCVLFFILGIGAWPTAVGGYFDRSSAAEKTGDFLPMTEAFQASVEQTKGYIELTWDIAPGYYLYQSKFSFELVDQNEQIVIGGLGKPDYSPAPVEIHDEFFGDVLIHSEIVVIRLKKAGLEAVGSQQSLQIEYQGCAKAGLCYPPSKLLLALR